MVEPPKRRTRRKTYQEPPPPPGGPDEWLKSKARLLFKPYKIPGWLLVLYWAAVTLPDIKARFEFWSEGISRFGPAFMTASNILQNPLFGFIVLVVGVLYIIFAGEPKKSAKSSRILSYVAWPASVFLLAALVMTTEAAAVATSISPIRTITPAQRATIVAEASELAPRFKNVQGQIMSLTVLAIDTPEINGYVAQIMSAFNAGGIGSQSTVPGMFAPIPMRALDTGIKGVFIQVKHPDNPPDGAVKLSKILNDAQISTRYFPSPQLEDSGFILTIGLPS